MGCTLVCAALHIRGIRDGGERGTYRQREDKEKEERGRERGRNGGRKGEERDIETKEEGKRGRREELKHINREANSGAGAQWRWAKG